MGQVVEQNPVFSKAVEFDGFGCKFKVSDVLAIAAGMKEYHK